MAYVALVLDEKSRQDVLVRFKSHIPEGWEVIAHHVTLHMGNASMSEIIEIAADNEYQIKAISIGKNDLVIALEMLLPASIRSANKFPHITLAVNRKAGGKPAMSNQLGENDLYAISPLILTTKLEELR